MNVAIPFIPETAPFTPEQRAWLNGLLAGMYSNAPQAAVEPRPSKRIAVLYASQSGTAEGLARKLAKELKAQGYAPTVSTLVGYTPASLAAESCALILASTYGDGDAPDGVAPFFEQLCLELFPRMDKLSYAVFALGARHYEHFCKFGKELDTKLAALGANRLADRIDCDMDLDELFVFWLAVLFVCLFVVSLWFFCWLSVGLFVLLLFVLLVVGICCFLLFLGSVSGSSYSCGFSALSL